MKAVSWKSLECGFLTTTSSATAEKASLVGLHLKLRDLSVATFHNDRKVSFCGFVYSP